MFELREGETAPQIVGLGMGADLQEQKRKRKLRKVLYAVVVVMGVHIVVIRCLLL